jgi:cytochrome P450
MGRTQLLDISSPQFKANPYPTYARLRAEEPVCRATIGGGRKAWLVTRHADVVALLRDGRFAKDPLNARDEHGESKAPWTPPLLRPIARNMLDLDAPDHTRLRALVQKAFVPRLVEQLRPRIASLTDELLGAAQRAGGIELLSGYALPVPLTIIAELIGVPRADQHQFHRWSTRVVSVRSAADLALALPSIWRMLRYMRGLIAQRRAEPRDDLLTALVQAEEAGDTLTEDELLGMMFILLAAGHETTVNLLASGALALLQHPEQRERLRREPSLIKPAVEELARYVSPVECATERYAREDLELAGVRVARGDLVLGVLGSANRDEAVFNAPDTLDLGREPNRHLAFGMGAHYCVGAPLARLEAQIAFAALLDRWPNLRLTVQPETLRWRRHAFLRGLQALPLAF